MTDPADPTQPPGQGQQPQWQQPQYPAPPPQYPAPPQQMPPPQMPPPQMPPPQMPPSQMPPPGQQPYQAAPPVAPQYGYGQGAPVAVPPGMFFDPASGLVLPNGTQLASVGRRIGAYFLSLLLLIVTLVIGYIIWGLILWGRGTSPAFSVLGMRVWKQNENKVATWGTMALRDIVGAIVEGVLGIITGLISFILFVSGKEHKSLRDLVASTVVIHDPNKVLG